MTPPNALSEELLPCPFCGDSQHATMQMHSMDETPPRKWTRVKCDTCGAMAPSTAWNSRAPNANAVRYEWLRSEEVATDPMYYPFWEECNAKLCRESRMDALIDKWMDGVPEPEPENELLRDDGALGVGA